MRLNVSQFRGLEGRLPALPENPVLARLEKLEQALLNLPVPQIHSMQYDNSDVLARLDRIEERVAKLAIKAPKATYDFSIVRDTSGKIVNVHAVPVQPKEPDNTIYRNEK